MKQPKMHVTEVPEGQEKEIVGRRAEKIFGEKNGQKLLYFGLKLKVTVPRSSKNLENKKHDGNYTRL